MKILCVIDSLGSGGAQRQLVSLAIGFKKRGGEISFLVYHSINFFKDLLDENNVYVHEIIEPNYLKRLLKMRRYIRNGEYDSVLSFLQASNFICEFAGLPWRKWKLVVGERSANPNIFKSKKLRAYRWFHFLADYVVANSYENIRIVRKVNPLLPPQKCRVIYNVVEHANWNPGDINTHLKDGKLKIVVGARHSYLKNLNGLIEAVNLLSEKDKKKLKIDWYGSDGIDQSKDEAMRKIEKYQLSDIFNFYNPTQDIHRRIQAADIVGLFSFYEGLPNTICEAMMAGKPVVASNVSDLENFLNHSPSQITDPNNPRQISERLSFFINTDSQTLQEIGNRNNEIAKSYFNQDLIIEKYLSLLQ